MTTEIEVEERRLDHDGWAAALLAQRWGSTRVVSRGQLHDAARLPGFVATLADENAGLVTYRIEGEECEIVTLDSLVAAKGIGLALINAVVRKAKAAGCRRLWLVTTNDNLNALRFYQKRGFRLVAVHANALERSRRLKPQIPLIGQDGIPLRDEIELELALA